MFCRTVYPNKASSLVLVFKCLTKIDDTNHTESLHNSENEKSLKFMAEDEFALVERALKEAGLPTSLNTSQT